MRQWFSFSKRIIIIPGTAQDSGTDPELKLGGGVIFSKKNWKIIRYLGIGT